MVYLTVILISSLIIAVCNCLFVAPNYGHSVWQVALYVSLSVIAAIIIDGVFAAFVRRCLPQKWFSRDKKLWSAGKKECAFYEKIGIKKWKDKVLDLGIFTGLRKNKISEPNNNDYIERYIIEANFGVCCHIPGVIFGYLVCLIFPNYWYSIGLPVGFVKMVLNGLALITLRYNLPKLRTLYSLNERRAKRKAESVDCNDFNENERAIAS